MTTLLVFAIALGSSLLLTVVARSLALRFQAVDEPDDDRKLHTHAVPLWGGVAVFFSLAIGLLVANLTPGIASPDLGKLTACLLFSGGCVFALGFVDDCVDLNGRLKLVVQIVSVAPVVAMGHWFDRAAVFNHPIELGYWGVPLMMFWLVGCVNAMNLLDGMDGNASVIGLVACGAIAMIATKHGHGHVAVIAVIMAGAILGFLVFNRPPARIYLGDAGSTVIGLVAGLLCIEGAYVPSGELRIAAPVAIMMLPILDTTLAIIRRSFTGRRFDAADRGHIHHRLQERGFNTWQALAIVAAICLATALAAVATSWTDCEPLAWITLLSLIVTLTQLRYFGHHELALACKRAVQLAGHAGDQVWILTHPRLFSLARRLPKLSFDDAWQLLTEQLSQWPTRGLEFSLREGDDLHARRTWNRSEGELPTGYEWQLAVTIGSIDAAQCELIISGKDSISSQPRYLGQLAAVMRLFGRYWSSEAGLATIPQLRLFDPSQPKTLPAFDQRQAA